MWRGPGPRSVVGITKERFDRSVEGITEVEVERVLGGPPGRYTDRPLADIRHVNPEYFATMGIPLRSGRPFAEADRAYRVALVSAGAAERLWPGEDPVGKRMQMGGDDTPLMQVVGVVGDVRGISLDKPPTMTVYVPYWQRFQTEALLAVRTPLDAAAIAPDLRRALHRVDPDLPVPAFRTMEEIVSLSVAERRFQFPQGGAFTMGLIEPGWRKRPV